MKNSVEKKVSVIYLLTLFLVVIMAAWWLILGKDWFINLNNPNPPLAPETLTEDIEDKPLVDDTEKPLQIVEIKKSI